MCWTYYYNKPSLQKAEKNITVYKLLIKTKNPYKTFSFKGLYYFILSLLHIIKRVYYISPIMNKHYKLNKRNKEIALNLKEFPEKYCIDGKEFYVNEGYHSFAYAYDLSSLKNVIKNLKKQTLKNVVIMECIIPKGSYYYKNPELEIVSSNIIINKEINY